MSALTYSAYKSVGDLQTKNFHYSQAVRIGDRIEASGQGGWRNDAQTAEDITIPTDLAEEIGQAFANVGTTLKAAGGKGWSQVYKVRSYHVGNPNEPTVDPAVLEIFIKALEKWAPNHKPLLTLLGVSALGMKGMRVEIEVEAYDPSS